MLENPFEGNLEILLYQMTPGYKIVDVFFRQIKNSPQHVIYFGTDALVTLPVGNRL